MSGIVTAALSALLVLCVGAPAAEGPPQWLYHDGRIGAVYQEAELYWEQLWETYAERSAGRDWTRSNGDWLPREQIIHIEAARWHERPVLNRYWREALGVGEDWEYPRQRIESLRDEAATELRVPAGAIEELREAVHEPLPIDSSRALWQASAQAAFWLGEDAFIDYLDDAAWAVMTVTSQDDYRAEEAAELGSYSVAALADLRRQEDAVQVDLGIGYSSTTPLVAGGASTTFASYGENSFLQLGLEVDARINLTQIEAGDSLDYIAGQLLLPHQSRASFYVHPLVLSRSGSRLLAGDFRNQRPLNSYLWTPQDGSVGCFYQFGLGGKLSHLARADLEYEQHVAGGAAFISIGGDASFDRADWFDYLSLELFGHGVTTSDSIESLLGPEADLSSVLASAGARGTLVLSGRTSLEVVAAFPIEGKDRELIGDSVTAFTLRYDF